ncbi:MAG: isochorismatase family cysteine hydrolase [Pseudomonadota bacterium]|jgi:nicotinamidase-related amidase|uniref:Nicotinamidase n=1 Tax=hydrothermal vent metagenome TaxID=652676 RepID=A0A170PPI2_9ZZZZ
MTSSWQEAESPARTALVLVDLQNSFLHPQGGNYYPAASALLPNLRRLLAHARSQGRLIIHVVDRHREGLADFESSKLPAHCIDGTFDAAFFEGFGPPEPAPANELIIVKRRFSAFLATDLDLLLRENGIGRLVLAGVKTNVCVRATIQDGFGLGYHCLLAREATNSNRTNLEVASVEDIERYMGWSVSMADAEAALG